MDKTEITGLSEKEVRQRTAKGLSNRTSGSEEKTAKDIIKENVLTYFNLIFLVLGILLIIAGAYNNLTFLPVVIANTLIGTIQELSAKKVLDKLTLLHAPSASVIRGGREQSVAVADLVQGDVIQLKSGSEIPADATVVYGEVSVNEAMLTGETDEIKKPAEAKLLSGSFVVAGECCAVLTAVGDKSYASQLARKAKDMKKAEQSEMIRSIDRLVKIAGILIIPVFAGLMYEEMVVNGSPFSTAITGSVAAVIGMIPEGLYLLVSVALVMSAMRLAKKNVMLHDMKSIETLSRVNVICVDKTGTVTEPEMHVEEVHAAADEIDQRNAELLLGDYIRAVTDTNETMKALRQHFVDHTTRHALVISAFSSALKYSRVKLSDNTVYALGAPEILTKNDPAYQEQLKTWASGGYRVLLFAETRDRDIYEDGLHGTVKPLLFILLKNPIRKNAPSTFRYFRKRKVEVKVISGDNPLTVSRVAQAAGIAHAQRYVDSRTLTSDAQIAYAVTHYAVFGRTTPEQKQKMVEALKKAGKTVAMTGDGVNDILAMKKADCSIAMASGSEAAMQAAQVVLLDSDFSHMKSIISEGRRNVNNIERSASLFLVKNIFSLMLAVFSIMNAVSYPLEPSQISLISMFNIGIPSFFLAMEPNEEPIRKGFMRRIIANALPGALTDYFLVMMLVVFAQEFKISNADVSIVSTYLMALVGFYVVYRISRPANRFRVSVLIGCIVGFLIGVLRFSSFFGIDRISGHATMLGMIFMFASFTVFYLFDHLFDLFADLSASLQKRAKASRE